MRPRRRHERFVRRLETEFAAENKNYRGISRDLSISGLFIRTQHAFVPDTLIDIVIHLPHVSDVKLKGRVKRSVKTPITSIKNGMGIEIIENDPRYVSFVRTVFPDAQAEPGTAGVQLDTSFHKHINELPQAEPHPPEFMIIACPQCNVKNKVNKARLSLGPKCGKCKTTLTEQS